jgi:hypothetical protein
VEFEIVRTAVFGVPRVTPPVGLVIARFTVSLGSGVPSLHTVTMNVFDARSRSAHIRVPEALT